MYAVYHDSICDYKFKKLNVLPHLNYLQWFGSNPMMDPGSVHVGSAQIYIHTVLYAAYYIN